MPRHELRSQQTGTGCKFTVVKIDVEQRRSERSILSQDGDGLGCHDWGGPMARMVTKEGPAPQPLLPSGGNGSVEESHDVSHHRPTALGCRSLQAICTGQGPAAACLQGPCTGAPPPQTRTPPGACCQRSRQSYPTSSHAGFLIRNLDGVLGLDADILAILPPPTKAALLVATRRSGALTDRCAPWPPRPCPPARPSSRPSAIPPSPCTDGAACCWPWQTIITWSWTCTAAGGCGRGPLPERQPPCPCFAGWT